jgi:hypothetical protein
MECLCPSSDGSRIHRPARHVLACNGVLTCFPQASASALKSMQSSKLGTVTEAYNPSYLGGTDGDNPCSRPS